LKKAVDLGLMIKGRRINDYHGVSIQILERARLTLPSIRVRSRGRPDLSLPPIFVNFPGCDNYDYHSVADIVDGYDVRDRSDLPPSRESANFVDFDNAVAPNPILFPEPLFLTAHARRNNWPLENSKPEDPESGHLANAHYDRPCKNKMADLVEQGMTFALDKLGYLCFF
jgi:hypothetical protein